MARIELRFDRFDSAAAARGLDTDAAIADHLGIDRATMWRIRQRRIAPGERFIAATLAAFPDLTFDALFTVVQDAAS